MEESKGILGGLFGGNNFSLIIIIAVVFILFSGKKGGFRLFGNDWFWIDSKAA